MDERNIPERHHLRVQELMIIFLFVKINSLHKELHHFSINLSNFLAWTKKLLNLIRKK